MLVKTLGGSQSIIQLKLAIKNGLRCMLRPNFNPRRKYHPSRHKTRKYHKEEQFVQNIRFWVIEQLGIE